MFPWFRIVKPFQLNVLADESLDELDWGCQGPLDWQYDPEQYYVLLSGGLLPIDRTILAAVKAGCRNIACIHELGRRYLGRYALCPGERDTRPP
jgi:hypothetical protein